MVSNGQKARRKRVKVREYFSSFPFFLATHGILALPWGSLLTWRPFLWFLENLKLEKGALPVADPDLQIRGRRGEGGYPDPEIRGGGPLPWILSSLLPPYVRVWMTPVPPPPIWRSGSDWSKPGTDLPSSNFQWSTEDKQMRYTVVSASACRKDDSHAPWEFLQSCPRSLLNEFACHHCNFLNTVNKNVIVTERPTY